MSAPADRDVAIAALADLSGRDTLIVLSAALVRLVCLAVVGVGVLGLAVLRLRDRIARGREKGRVPQ